MSQTETPPSSIEVLEKATQDLNTAVNILHGSHDILLDKAAQLAGHEALLGTEKDTGHIKLGTGFERLADGTVNITGTAAFEDAMALRLVKHCGDALPETKDEDLLFSTLYGCVMYWDETLGFYRSLRPVDISFSMRPKAALNPGEYVADGTKYLLTSKQGKVLNALPAATKSAWRITVSGTQISSPTMIHTDKRYFYPRFGATPGVVTEDAIRNITGTYSPYANDHGAIIKDYANENASISGAFTRGTVTPFAPGNAANAEGYKLAFNASLVVPTADENRTLCVTFTPVLWLGV